MLETQDLLYYHVQTRFIGTLVGLLQDPATAASRTMGLAAWVLHKARTQEGLPEDTRSGGWGTVASEAGLQQIQVLPASFNTMGMPVVCGNPTLLACIVHLTCSHTLDLVACPFWLHLDNLWILACRSRTDIERAYIRQWKRTTARDGDVKPQTVLTTLGFIPIWLKYNAVPNIVRYVWFIVWSAVRRQYLRFHTWAVLQGVIACEAPAALARSAPQPPALCKCA